MNLIRSLGGYQAAFGYNWAFFGPFALGDVIEELIFNYRHTVASGAGEYVALSLAMFQEVPGGSPSEAVFATGRQLIRGAPVTLSGGMPNVICHFDAAYALHEERFPIQELVQHSGRVLGVGLSLAGTGSLFASFRLTAKPAKTAAWVRST